MEHLAVVGIGKLGLCFALQLERSGYNVLGVDNRPDYVQSLNNKTFTSLEPGVNDALKTCRHFTATDQLEQLCSFHPEVIFIGVATPTADTHGYDHSMLSDLLSRLYDLDFVQKRKEIVVMCTTLPGYCDSKADEARKHGYFLSYKPEFIAQGSIMHDLQYPDQMLIGAADTQAAERLVSIYSNMCVSTPAVSIMSRLSAEITKLATNCFLTMKISFANAIGDLCQISGAETDKVLNAIGSDSRIGNKFLRYGFGFGGPCFPRDNRALNYFAAEKGYDLILSTATDEINSRHLHFQFDEYMNRYGNGQPIDFFSVAYKEGTAILEESQQLALAVKLAKAGRKVVIHETEEVVGQLEKLYGDLFQYKTMK